VSKDWWTAWSAGGNPQWGGLGLGRGARFFGAGEVRLSILSLLSEAPKHGYQLMKELAERSGGLYKASAGSVYPALQQLEEEDLIATSQQGGRRVCRITRAGRRELEKDPQAVQRIWERAEECEDWGQFMTPDNVQVFQSIGKLVKAGLQASRRAGAEPVREILDRTRRQLEEL
jgi:DNA-binding PadR family transcriptional regulator